MPEATPMKLLLSNDDGIFAPGIRALADTLAAAGHQVTVVCPDRERSATGHGLTLHKPIRADEIDGLFAPQIKAWACSGTPSDCVKLALGALIEEVPDMVLSGINQGANLGTDILYSGTVSAAMEGVIEGLPAIAFSLSSFQTRDFQPAATFAQALVAVFEKQPLPVPMLLNVNVPPVPRGEMKGALIARQGMRRYIDMFEKRIDPRGKVYYWLAGEVTEEGGDVPPDHAALTQILQGLPDFANLETIPTDVQGIRDRYVTITPLQYNLTSWVGLTHLQQWQASGGNLPDCPDQTL